MRQYFNKRYGLILLAAVVFAFLYMFRAWFASAPPPKFVAAFTNVRGGYSFEVPEGWQAATNQYNRNNSLFGPVATGATGLGGVEIFPSVKSVDSFLVSSSAEYYGRTNVLVDGAPAIRVHYKGVPASGESVVLLRNGMLYNIYINSTSAADLAYFDRLLSSFNFLK